MALQYLASVITSILCFTDTSCMIYCSRTPLMAAMHEDNSPDLRVVDETWREMLEVSGLTCAGALFFFFLVCGLLLFEYFHVGILGFKFSMVYFCGLPFSGSGSP